MKGLYNTWLQHLLDMYAAGDDFVTAPTLKLLTIIDSGTAYNADLGDAGDEFLSDIPALARGGIAPLAGVSFAGRSLDANDLTGALPDGGDEDVIAFVLFDDTGVEGTSRLIYYDNEATGLPLGQDGTADNLTVPEGGFFTIG